MIGLHESKDATDLIKSGRKGRIGGISGHVAKGSTARGTGFAWINGEVCKGWEVGRDR